MIIRLGIEADLVDLTNLMGELGYETTTGVMKNRLAKLTNNLDYHTIVAEVDNKVVGLLGLYIGLAYEFTGYYGRIVCLIVNKQFRKNGIGKELIERAKKIVSEHDGNILVLNSGNRNERKDAHEFYVTNGFKVKSTGFVMKLD